MRPAEATETMWPSRIATLLPVLDLKEGELFIRFSSLFKRAEEKMSEESFDASCGRCEWYRQGYCDFPEYDRSLKEINRIFFL